MPNRSIGDGRVFRALSAWGVPGTQRLFRTLSPPPTKRTPFTTKVLGLEYSGDLSEQIDWCIFHFGSYSPAELDFLHRASKVASNTRHSPVTFFDIGANVGQHSLYMSSKVDRIYAFEPARKSADQFVLNVHNNNLKNISLHRVALGNTDEEAMLGSGLPGNSGSRSLNWTLPDADGEVVAVKDAASFFAAQKLPQIDILKLDVEGHESKVIESLGSRLRQDRPIILMELLGDDAKGGFASVDHLRGALYPDHQLHSLAKIRHRNAIHGSHQLVDFDWDMSALVVIPKEIAHNFL